MTDKTTRGLKARDIMTEDPVAVYRSASLHAIAEAFDTNEISGLPVLDESDRVIGIVSKTDVIHRCLEGPPGAREGMEFWDKLRVERSSSRDLNPEDLGVAEDFMSIEPVTVGPDESVASVARLMAEERVHRVAVVDGERHLLGIITSLDMMRVFPGD